MTEKGLIYCKTKQSSPPNQPKRFVPFLNSKISVNAVDEVLQHGLIKILNRMPLERHESICSPPNPTYGKIVGQTGHFNHSKATSLGEEKLDLNKLYAT